MSIDLKALDALGNELTRQIIANDLDAQKLAESYEAAKQQPCNYSKESCWICTCPSQEHAFKQQPVHVTPSILDEGFVWVRVPRSELTEEEIAYWNKTASLPKRELSFAQMEDAAGVVFILMNPNLDWAMVDKETANLFGQLAAACALTWGMKLPTRIEGESQ